MVFTVLFGLSALLGFVGNLLVLLVVILYRDFRHMRYFLLASLALSDWIFAVLVAGSRTMANAAEKWIFGITWCHGVAFITRVLHHSTCFHLCAVSWCHRQKAAELQQPHHKEKSLSCSGTAMDFTSPYLPCSVPRIERFRLQPGYFRMRAEVGRPNSNSDVNRHISCATWSDHHSKLQSPQSCPSASTQCWNHQ